MKHFIFSFIIMIANIFPSKIFAASFSKPTSSNEISNRRVLMASQDPDGYLWFATRSGIDKYNGVNFKNYILNNDSSGLEHPVGLFRFDKNIYAYSEKNIFRYSPENDEFKMAYNINLKGDMINVVKADYKGNIFIGTLYKLLRVRKNMKEPEIIRDNISVFSIEFERLHNMGWIGTDKGISIINHNNGSFKLNKVKYLELLNNEKIQSMYFDYQTGSLWIGSFANGLYKLNSNKSLIKINKEERSLPIKSITPIGNNQMWVGVDGAGIIVYNRFGKNKIKEFSLTQKGENYLQTNNVYNILNLKDNIIICTYTDGIFLYKKYNIVNTTFQNIENDNQSIKNNHVNYSMEDSKGRIWFGTNMGVSRLDPKTNTWKHFSYNINKNAVVLYIQEDKKGNIWVGGYALDIIYIDSKDNIHYPNKLKETNKHYIFCIQTDNEGNLWFGENINFLSKYNPETGLLQKYPIKGIKDFKFLNKDSIIIASGNDIRILNTKDKKHSILNVFNKQNKRNLVPQQICINPSNKNDLWIATEDMGVLNYNIKTKTLIEYNTSHGLTSNNICGVQFDKQQRVWVSTENGLNCINPEFNNINTFHIEDGILSNIFNLRAQNTLDNGNLIWGTPYGAFIINPDIYKWDRKPSFNLHFEDFYIYNKIVKPNKEDSPLKKIVDKTEEIKLKYNQRSFSLSFLNIEKSNSINNVYEWYLDGFENQWNAPSLSNIATYTNIPIGEYTFRVRAIGKLKNEVSQERSIKIVVLPAWWNSGLAKLAYLITIITIIYYLIRFYKNRQEAIESDNKIKFFINIAHDIRTPLTLIKGPLTEIKSENLSENGKNSLKLANNNIDKLMDVVNELLDFQKIERSAMKLYVEETNIKMFFNNIVNNFQIMAKEKHISLTYNCENVNIDTTGYIDRKKITQITDNLLSNALKYTKENGNVNVRTVINGNTLTIKVIDDGIGIPKKSQKKLFTRFYRADNSYKTNELGSGIGLVLVKKMTLLHKGQISLSSKPNLGSTFTVEIPINQDAYKKTEILIKEENTIKQDIIEEENNDNSTKLLLVEDNNELRDYMYHILNKSYNVITASNGLEALECITKENPDFILSDVMMPEMDGIQLCSKVKSNIETCHIPVILLTALSEREDIIKGLNAGADDYITKPFDITILKKKINTLIKNRILFRKKYIDKTAFNSEETGMNELDKSFMLKVVEYIEENMPNEDFTIDNLAIEMAMSRSVFYKKIKSLTGQGPHDFIRDIKMKKAVNLIKEKKYPIGEIAYLTGFPNAKYFSTAFKKYYGVSPSQFEEQEKYEIETEN